MKLRTRRALVIGGLALTFVTGIVLGTWKDLRAQSAADLYIKDTPLDLGGEPNGDPGPMWVSEDIWNRTTADPGYKAEPFPSANPSWVPLPHQNPEYRDPKYSNPNWMYVRVHNRGSGPSSGTERLRTYWAKASTGLAWDGQWVDYMAQHCGSTPKLYGIEVTKPRKDAALATQAERDAYRDAIIAMDGMSFTDIWGNSFPGNGYWPKQNEVHADTSFPRHTTVAFLPWHREFLNRYEILLQEADPTVKLLYWDWTTDPENSKGFNFYTSSFMGASGRGTGGVQPGAPFGAQTSNVVRRLSNSTSPPAQPDAALMAHGSYASFNSANESCPNHNCSHGYLNGSMSFIGEAARDPFFYLLHTNVDRLWAQWQRDITQLGRIVPATAYDLASGQSVINQSLQPWNGTGNPIRPWTAADGWDFAKTSKHSSVVSPPTYDTAPLVIPVLQADESVVLQIPWYPPNPADFACFGADQGHVCLLARIETATAAPFGMTIAEGTSVGTNTRNNNNIAWRNITVVDDFAGSALISSALVRNVFEEPIEAGLRFENAAEFGPSFFEEGRIEIEMPRELLRRWQEAGGEGEGIEIISATLRILSPAASIRKLPLAPGEVFPLQLRFLPNRDYLALRDLRPKWDVIQVGSPSDEEEVVGGQRFEIDLSRLDILPGRGEWRFLDGGLSPGPGWEALEFDDSRWRQGPAPLGFGDPVATQIDGGPEGRRHITTYFRKTFEIDAPWLVRSLQLSLRRDDGALIYLNGEEIHRDNMPAGAIAADTPAMRDVDGLEERVMRSVSLEGASGMLRAGTNILAVELHQASPRSDDLAFDLALLANSAQSTAEPKVEIRSPALGALLPVGRRLEVEADTVAGSAPVETLELWVDGERIDEARSPDLRLSWPEPTLGTKRLRVVALAADQVAGEAVQDVTVVANVPPTIDILLPPQDRIFDRGVVVSVDVSAQDVDGQIERVEYYLKDAEEFASPNEMVAVAASTPFGATLVDLEEGHYMLTAVAYDDGGLSGASAYVHFDVFEVPSALSNLSTRGKVGTVDDVMIGGFIIDDGPLEVIVRALGPKLVDFGVPNPLLDPTLEIRDAQGELVAICDDWQGCVGAGQLGALTPEHPSEAALRLELQPGGYTAIVRGKNTSTGVALVEVFDAGGSGRLSNLSTRGKVGIVDDVMIGGFIVKGGAMDVIVRAIGPKLADFDVPKPLADPTLEIRDSQGGLVVSCDDWQGCVGASELGALTPEHVTEAALKLTLQPGGYTAIVRGKNVTTGIALVEVFEVD